MFGLLDLILFSGSIISLQGRLRPQISPVGYLMVDFNVTVDFLLPVELISWNLIAWDPSLVQKAFCNIQVAILHLELILLGNLANCFIFLLWFFLFFYGARQHRAAAAGGPIPTIF